MSIVARIKELNLPEAQYVVIGSGVLDALGLREAHDIDLVVTPEFFETLRHTEGWKIEQKHGEEVLTHDDLEVWLGWGSEDHTPNFEQLYTNGITIDGIRFANPAFVRDWKIAANRPKDQADIQLLSEYLA